MDVDIKYCLFIKDLFRLNEWSAFNGQSSFNIKNPEFIINNEYLWKSKEECQNIYSFYYKLVSEHNYKILSKEDFFDYVNYIIKHVKKQRK